MNVRSLNRTSADSSSHNECPRFTSLVKYWYSQSQTLSKAWFFSCHFRVQLLFTHCFQKLL